MKNLDNNTIRLIEEYPLDLENEVGPRANILLTLLGYKKGFIEFLDSYNRTGKQEDFQGKGLKNLLGELDLPYREGKTRTEYRFPNGEAEVAYKDLLVGKDKPSLERLHQARNPSIVKRLLGGQEYDHEEIGRCLGYPETAIEAFAGKRARKKEKEEYMPISSVANFVFSEGNYTQELDFLRQEDEAIRKVSPTIYRMLQDKLEKYFSSRRAS